MNLASIYSVPFWQSVYPDFEEHKEIFLDLIKKYRSENPTVYKSNVFGYQSPDTLQSVKKLEPLFNYICHMGFKASADLNFVDCDVVLMSIWLNINDKRQSMNSDHVHNGVFSGTFYLSIPNGSGNLVLRNPLPMGLWKGKDLSSEKNEYTGENIRIIPEEGNIVLFPSYLPHSVETNNHDEERISISFNMGVFPKGSVNLEKIDCEY